MTSLKRELPHAILASSCLVRKHYVKSELAIMLTICEKTGRNLNYLERDKFLIFFFSFYVLQSLQFKNVMTGSAIYATVICNCSNHGEDK